LVHALGRAHSTCSDSREGDVSGCPGDVGANSQGGARARERESERERQEGGRLRLARDLQTKAMEVVAGKRVVVV